MSRTQYERQARALQNEIDRLDVEVKEARRVSSGAIKEFDKVRAVTPRRDRNWLLFVLLNGDRDARDRFLSLRRQVGTRSSEVQRSERDLKTANKKLAELVVDGLRRYDNKYGKVEKELSENRQARIACERTLGAAAVARKEAAQAARSAPQRSRRDVTSPEVELVAARVSAAIQVVRDSVDEFNRKARSGNVIRSALIFTMKHEFSGVRVDRSKRVSEFTRVVNALTALEKDVQALRGKISTQVTMLESDLRRRQEIERERVRVGLPRAQ
jgi:predicted  nucleic acid-binding Zn-ribbon protein